MITSVNINCLEKIISGTYYHTNIKISDNNLLKLIESLKARLNTLKCIITAGKKFIIDVVMLSRIINTQLITDEILQMPTFPLEIIELQIGSDKYLYLTSILGNCCHYNRYNLNIDKFYRKNHKFKIDTNLNKYKEAYKINTTFLISEFGRKMYSELLRCIRRER